MGSEVVQLHAILSYICTTYSVFLLVGESLATRERSLTILSGEHSS